MPKHHHTNNNHPATNVPIHGRTITKHAHPVQHHRTFVPAAQTVTHTRTFVPAAQPVVHSQTFVPAAQPVVHSQTFVPAAPIAPLHALMASRTPSLNVINASVQHGNTAVPQRHLHQFRK